MVVLAKQKPKVRSGSAAGKLPSVLNLDLGNSFSPWASLGHGKQPPALPALFGAPRFTKEDQAAHPGERMTRLVKDVLRVGSWKVGVDRSGKPIMWDVTRDTLKQIAGQLALANSRGVAMNLTKSHGDRDTGLVPTDDLLTPIDRAVVEGDTLWISTYVNSDEKKFLSNPAMKVSPSVWRDWIDGEGNSYPVMLVHVAVTDKPVVTGQGSFVSLANEQGTQGASVMDFETALDLFTRAFDALGLTMPENVTEETLPVVVDALLASAGGGETEEEETTDMGDLTDAAADAAAGDEMPAQLANAQVPAWAKALQQQVANLSNELASGKKETAKAAYTKRLQELAVAGKINAKQVINLSNSGEKHGHDLALLDPFEDAQALQMGRQVKNLANGKAPKVNGVKGVADPDDRQAKVNALLGNTKRKPTKTA